MESGADFLIRDNPALYSHRLAEGKAREDPAMIVR
jgi:hypothetical protein